MKEIKAHTIEDTNKLAEKIAMLLNGNGCICLSGDLGAGKTTFTKALGKALGIEEVITSPTFNILKIYEGKHNLYHIDAYRLEGLKQDLGFEEVFEEDGICVIEWYEFIKDIIPQQRLEIEIVLDGETRVFKIHGTSSRYVEIEGEI